MQQSYLPKAIRHLEKAIYAFGGYQRIHSRTEATPQFIIQSSETMRTLTPNLEGHRAIEDAKLAKHHHPIITDDPDQGKANLTFRVWTSTKHSSEPEMTDDKFTETPFVINLTYIALPRMKSDGSLVLRRLRLEKQYRHFIDLEVLRCHTHQRNTTLFKDRWEIDHRTKRALVKRKKENKRNTIITEALQEAYDNAKTYHSNHHPLEEDVNIYLERIEPIITARKATKS